MQRPYTVPEAAKQIGVSEVTVRRLVAARQIPHRRVGGRIMFTEADLEEFLEASKRPAVTGSPPPGGNVIPWGGEVS
jgi:excisionase family DNA binding protein